MNILSVLAHWVLIVLVGLPACALAVPPESRDPWLWPFSSQSIWNTPIGSDAEYVSAGITRAARVDIDDEVHLKVPAGSPVRTVYAPLSWETRAGGKQVLGEVPVPDDFIIADARKGWTPNNCAAFLLPDDRTVVNIGPLCRIEQGGPVYGYLFDRTDLWGDGIAGSHGGSRISALGGSIRLGELTGPDPIRHALKVNVFCKRFAYFDDVRKGFRWPATGADSYASKESYGGKIPGVVMGSLLAIHPSATPEKLGLKTAVGRKLFAALQDFGAYVVDDTAWDCHHLNAAYGVSEEVKQKTGLDIRGDKGELVDDINTLFAALHLIDNNTPETIGGGGKPRFALAPALPPPPAPAARPAPMLTNGSMTQGREIPDGWTHKWEGEGKLTVTRDEKIFKVGPAALRIAAAGGKVKGQVSQMVDAQPGDVVRFSGFVKTAGMTATVGIMTYTKDWGVIEFHAFHQAQPTQDWHTFSGEWTLPARTARCAFAVIVDGKGSAWLDECNSGAASGEQKAQTKEHAKEPAKDTEKVIAPPKAANAWSPGEGFFADYPKAWRNFHDGFVERAAKGNADVVFIGDSITQGWGGPGAKVWAEYYEKRKPVNFAIGGDGTPQVLWRVGHGTLDGLSPKLVVLMIGTNNRWRGDATPETVSRGVEACVKLIREKTPAAKVLVLGIFPTQERADHPDRALFTKANESIAKLADAKSIFYLDLGSRFLSPDGTISAETMPDFLHLTDEGYHIWAEAMEPTIKRLLGE